jgi:ubiquinol-cytochrome c reductase cytochrome b subunit
MPGAGPVQPLLDWLDSRTGYRTGLRHLLEEPLPSGVGWLFVTGSVVMFLVGVQFVTGVVLSMFYVPAPAYAYDSVRFIMERLAFGSVLRGLHFFGASFLVIAAVVHMLRVVVLGSYKKPREVTWITGVVLLLLILAFALSGYLLPWDQKAYWATTVTINIARSGPFGEHVAALLRGGSELGALTLLRWYSAHVFLLPAALIGFVVSHVYLMRRHQISGPITPVPGPSKPFYPYHLVKDTLAMAAVFAVLLTFAVVFPAPLDEIADPTDATYVPRPEWYFLSLFQLLKYFPGPLEPVATVVIPGAVVGLLLALPFLDRRPERHPRTRLPVMAGFALLGIGVAALTALGLRDTPVRPEPSHWSLIARSGLTFSTDERCVSCHRSGGAANALAETQMRRDPPWVLAHVRDPELIDPGVREPLEGAMNASQARSILSYMKKVRAGAPVPPALGQAESDVAFVLGRYCAGCHMIDGEGESSAPDLSAAGGKKDAAALRAWITSPESVDETATMPAFGGALTPGQMDAIVGYLAARK